MTKRKRLSPSFRFLVLRKFCFRCAYCGRSAKDGANLEVDHAISVFDGGSNSPENLVAACHDCNTGKGAKSLPVDHRRLKPILPSQPYRITPRFETREQYLAWKAKQEGS